MTNIDKIIVARQLCDVQIVEGDLHDEHPQVASCVFFDFFGDQFGDNVGVCLT